MEGLLEQLFSVTWQNEIVPRQWRERALFYVSISAVVIFSKDVINGCWKW